MGGTKHVMSDCIRLIEYRRILAENQCVYLEKSHRDEVLGVGTYRLKMRISRALSSSNASEWITVIRDEINSIEKNQVLGLLESYLDVNLLETNGFKD